jgi:hypothetical protein
VKLWIFCIGVHHDGEETDFFPAVEVMCGEKGVMDENIAQHAIFHSGSKSLDCYAEECLQGKTQYDGKKIVEIIDGFGESLTTHLKDEITSLLRLERFGMDKVQGIKKVLEKDAEKNMVSRLANMLPV